MQPTATPALVLATREHAPRQPRLASERSAPTQHPSIGQLLKPQPRQPRHKCRAWPCQFTHHQTARYRRHRYRSVHLCTDISVALGAAAPHRIGGIGGVHYTAHSACRWPIILKHGATPQNAALLCAGPYDSIVVGTHACATHRDIIARACMSYHRPKRVISLGAMTAMPVTQMSRHKYMNFPGYYWHGAC
jgi:hypothetical protein